MTTMLEKPDPRLVHTLTMCNSCMRDRANFSLRFIGIETTTKYLDFSGWVKLVFNIQKVLA
eukprot:snap_masked-scaffold_5-processed-gene-19.37-mRNA-1 protein AED:1.00 eAED:1.00 QI:0/0/0/0/1/1/2/0/60